MSSSAFQNKVTCERFMKLCVVSNLLILKEKQGVCFEEIQLFLLDEQGTILLFDTCMKVKKVPSRIFLVTAEVLMSN